MGLPAFDARTPERHSPAGSGQPPRTAYVLLWFPVPTETFVFREIRDLKRLGLPVQVFTLYGERSAHLSVDMKAGSPQVQRLGWQAVPSALRAIAHWGRRKPGVVSELLRTLGHQRWGDPEKSGENILALLASFELARRFEVAGIEHIHACWASGCATAAWAASKLTGIPFSFTARAWDIHPPDALIERKIRDAALVRAETEAARRHLLPFAEDQAGKLRVTYNGATLRADRGAPVPMRSPYRLLAIGRFVPKKGFDQLLLAVRLLRDAGVDVCLTLAGDGALRRRLQRMTMRLGVEEIVRFPGFVPHDLVAELFLESDVFVMPSVVAPSGDRDGLPTVIIEALTYGLPVVATSIAGIPELIEDGVTGLLVPDRDPEALAAAIRRLVTDRDAALAMSVRGRARVHERCDPERNHRAVLDLYCTIAPRPEAGEVRAGLSD